MLRGTPAGGNKDGGGGTNLPDLRVLQNPLRRLQVVEDSYQEEAQLPTLLLLQLL